MMTLFFFFITTTVSTKPLHSKRTANFGPPDVITQYYHAYGNSLSYIYPQYYRPN